MCPQACELQRRLAPAPHVSTLPFPWPCSRQAIVSGTLVSITTVGASSQAGEPAPSSTGAVKSVWYSWTGDYNGTVSVASFDASFDTVIAVYRDTTHAFNGLQLVRAARGPELS